MAWVDVLFVLSALLAALQLLPALEDRRPGAPTCRAVVLRYWRRRAARMLPAYLLTTLLGVVALGPPNPSKEAVVQRWMHQSACPAGAWANLLFVQNWLPAACPIHLWTVAVQESRGGDLAVERRPHPPHPVLPRLPLPAAAHLTSQPPSVHPAPAAGAILRCIPTAAVRPAAAAARLPHPPRCRALGLRGWRHRLAAAGHVAGGRAS